MQHQHAFLLLDKDVWPGLSMALRDSEIDTVSVLELGRTGLSNDEQPAFAMQEGRAILTHNIADCMALALVNYRQQQNHYCIVVAPQLEKGVGTRNNGTVRIGDCRRIDVYHPL